MTQHACLNPRCIGIRIYTGLSVDAAGAFVETYTCTRCHVVSVEAAVSADVVVYLDADRREWCNHEDAPVESAVPGEYQGQVHGEERHTLDDVSVIGGAPTARVPSARGEDQP